MKDFAGLNLRCTREKIASFPKIALPKYQLEETERNPFKSPLPLLPPAKLLGKLSGPTRIRTWDQGIMSPLL